MIHPEEHAQLWKSWEKVWGWDGAMSEEYEKDRLYSGRKAGKGKNPWR